MPAKTPCSLILLPGSDGLTRAVAAPCSSLSASGALDVRSVSELQDQLETALTWLFRDFPPAEAEPLFEAVNEQARAYAFPSGGQKLVVIRPFPPGAVPSEMAERFAASASKIPLSRRVDLQGLPDSDPPIFTDTALERFPGLPEALGLIDADAQAARQARDQARQTNQIELERLQTLSRNRRMANRVDPSKSPMAMVSMSVNTSTEGVFSFDAVFDDFVALAPLGDLLAKQAVASRNPAKWAELWERSAELLRSKGASVQGEPLWIENNGRLVLCFSAEAPGGYISFSDDGARRDGHIPKSAFGEAVASRAHWLRDALPNAAVCSEPANLSEIAAGDRERLESLQGDLDRRQLEASKTFLRAKSQPPMRAFLEAADLRDSSPATSSAHPKKAL